MDRLAGSARELADPLAAFRGAMRDAKLAAASSVQASTGESLETAANESREISDGESLDAKIAECAENADAGTDDNVASADAGPTEQEVGGVKGAVGAEREPQA